MATQKAPGILSRMKDAVSGMFSSTPARKSPKNVAAGKKAATTAKVDKAVAATGKVVTKAVKKATAPARKRAAKKRR